MPHRPSHAGSSSSSSPLCRASLNRYSPLFSLRQRRARGAKESSERAREREGRESLTALFLFFLLSSRFRSVVPRLLGRERRAPFCSLSPYTLLRLPVRSFYFFLWKVPLLSPDSFFALILQERMRKRERKRRGERERVKQVPFEFATSSFIDDYECGHRYANGTFLLRAHAVSL